LDRARDDFAARGARLVLIGQATPRQAAHFRERQGLTVPVLADRERESYRAVGARSGSLGDLVSPSVLVKGLATVARTGKIQTRPIGDPAQLGAAAVIGPDGTYRLRRTSKDASDNVDPAVLLAALDRRGPEN
jgi:hypothetical protein